MSPCLSQMKIGFSHSPVIHPEKVGFVGVVSEQKAPEVSEDEFEVHRIKLAESAKYIAG